MRYRMLAIDLDGTFLDSCGRIRDDDRQAVLEAARRGVRVVLASGRMLAAVEPTAEELGLTDPIVAYNGAKVLDRATRVCLLHAPLDPDLAAEIVAHAEDSDIHVNYYLNDTLYVRDWTPWAELYHNRTGSPIICAGSLKGFAGCRPTKLILIMTPEEGVGPPPSGRSRARTARGSARGSAPFACRAAGIEKWFPIYRDRYRDRLCVMVTNDEYLEFMNKEASKATGVAAAAQFLGIPRNSILALGDGRNDIALLKWAGLGVAMGNSPASVREGAEVVAPCNDEGGVTWAVREFVLGEG